MDSRRPKNKCANYAALQNVKCKITAFSHFNQYFWQTNHRGVIKCNVKVTSVEVKLLPLNEKHASKLNTSRMQIKIIRNDCSTVTLFGQYISIDFTFCTYFAMHLEIHCEQGLRIFSFLRDRSIIPLRWEYFDFFDDPVSNNIVVC